jgi:hypothetical protein
MIHATLSQLSTAVSADTGSAPSTARMRAGIRASSSRARKAAKLKVIAGGQSRLKGLHDRRQTGETRSSGKNRHQEPLRQRTSFIERLCSCISACEICLARASYRRPNRRVCPQGNKRTGSSRNPIMNHTNRWQRYPFQTYLPQGQGTVSAGCFFSRGFRQTGQFFCHMFAPSFLLLTGLKLARATRTGTI